MKRGLKKQTNDEGFRRTRSRSRFVYWFLARCSLHWNLCRGGLSEPPVKERGDVCV